MEIKETSWSESEISELFAVVNEYKNQNRPLINAFEKYAQEKNRKPNSVRNFYYKTLAILEKNVKLSQKYGINLKNHQKCEQNFFSVEEYNLSMEKINNLIKRGYSVRKACLEVALGDIKQMLRLQNKYRSSIVKKKNKIIVMPTKKAGLSDEEINSLFLGLVNLVKKSAKESADTNIIEQIKSANNELRKSIKELADKEREVILLRKKFELLSSEKSKLKEEIRCLRSQNVELLKAEQYPTKFNKLKNYLQKLEKKHSLKKN